MTLKQRLTDPTSGLVLLGLLYVASRLTNLLSLPMVFDEAIYLRWADLIRDDPWANRFIASVDGKPPFFFWVNAITLGWFEDILLSARMISVVAGALALAGVYRIGTLLYSRETGLLAALLYISLPLVLTHDRLGLTDSLLTAFVIWTLYASLRLVKDPTPAWRWALGLGVFAGLGFLTKTPLLMFLVLPLLAVVLFNDVRNRALWGRLLLAGGVFGLLVLPFLLHRPDYTFPQASKLLHHKLSFLDTLTATLTLNNPRMLPHLQELAGVGRLYVTGPVLLLFIAGAIAGLRRGDRARGFLLAWCVVPTAVFLIFSEAAYPRYYLVALPPVALIAAESLRCLMTRLHATLRTRSAGGAVGAAAVLGIACLLPAWQWDMHYLAAPDRAAWTELDHWQYIRYPEGPHAVEDAVRFFKSAAQQQPIAVFLTLKPGIPGDALYLYLKGEPRIAVYEAWRGIAFPRLLQKAQGFRIYHSKYKPDVPLATVPVSALAGKPLYFVANVNWFPPPDVRRENPELVQIQTYNDLNALNFFSFAMYRQAPPAAR